MRRIGLLVALLVAAGCNRQEAPSQQAQAAAIPAEAAPAAPGAKGKVSREGAGKLAPPVEISALDPAAKLKLAELKGRPVLVNLWATWCAPCVRELPSLDKLAAARAGLQLIAISEDMDGAKVVRPFLAKRGIATLKPYHDNDNGLMLALKEAELPITILYGADGRERWRVRGPMDWNGAEARALLAEAGA